MSNPLINPKFLKRVRRADRMARGLIISWGVGIIAVVIGMLFLIAGVALPLFGKSEIKLRTQFEVPDAADCLGVGMDDYLETGFVLDRDGSYRIFELTDGAELSKGQLPMPTGTSKLLSLERSGPLRFAARYDNGAAAQYEFKFEPEFDDEGTRTITQRIKTLNSWPALSPVPERTLLAGDSETGCRVDLLSDGRVRVVRLKTEESLFGDEETVQSEGYLESRIEEIVHWAVDAEARHLYLVGDGDRIERWDIRDAENAKLLDFVEAYKGKKRIDRMALMLGDISLALADEEGGLSTWMPIRRYENAEQKQLTRIHDLRAHAGPVEWMLTSQRNKTLVSADREGRIQGDYMTSEKALFELASGGPQQSMELATRGNGLIALSREGQLRVWEIDNPHPEITFKSLFGSIWYENYDEPKQVWQSSAAGDDFEPKLSLRPLIFGTLKGTLYAMLFAAPLAILGALYTSQFMDLKWKNTVKPMIEIMAAVPSVVVGFLGGLWLAPRLETVIPGVFLCVIIIPLSVLTLVWIYGRMQGLRLVRRLNRGLEFVGLVPAVLLGFFIAIQSGYWFEDLFFSGDFKQWCFDTFEMRVDQRNSIVIAFALGFAVIPIIFTMAEDALSAVPRHLTAASLALGASRWQTAWRVVLPSASPGIFAALMIGLGRAVGETMIVLMATGNTPIQEWSIFNGMRTLSANIAVEIPEAPVDGTLYRTLFLSAVILFIFTFIINTLAEMIRIRLRKKYGN